MHKIALSHQVKVVKANYTNALRLTPAPYVVLCAFENIMGLPVKTNLAAVKLKVDLVLGLDLECVVALNKLHPVKFYHVTW